MATSVRGKNLEITAALKDYVLKHEKKIMKYFDTDVALQAMLSVEKESKLADLTLWVGGVVLRVEETGEDMYAAIDIVLDKLVRQIHKYKTRLMKSKYSNFADTAVPAPAPAAEVADEGEFEIIKNKRFVMHPMTPEEAILQMNLLNHDFFVFYDPDLGATNVVYRRKDGKYGLLSPELK